jgi:hypothetical protein
MVYRKMPEDVEEAYTKVTDYLVDIDPDSATPEGRLLMAMTDYLEEYEKKHYPI